MDMPLATFCYDELEKIMIKAGFTPGTDTFNEEFRRRYRATDGNHGRYMERHTWLTEQAA